jgi:hypothetical protein
LPTSSKNKAFNLVHCKVSLSEKLASACQRSMSLYLQSSAVAKSPLIHCVPHAGLVHPWIYLRDLEVS